jgi:hypothetical protein
MIGDQLDRDIGPAKEAGLRTIYFPGGFAPGGRPINIPFNRTFGSIGSTLFRRSSRALGYRQVCRAVAFLSGQVQLAAATEHFRTPSVTAIDRDLAKCCDS